MPHGVHKSKRPSGCQQRKSKKKRCDSLKSLPGSMLRYVKKLDDGQGSSKDVPQSTIDTDSSDASSMHSIEEQVVQKIDEIDDEIQKIYVYDLEAAENDDNVDSNQDTANVMLSQVNEKNWNILSDASFWNVPVPDNFRVEIIKRGSPSFQNKDGPFCVVTRQDEKAKGDVRKLTKQWFYKMMPNGEKILRSWMVYSPVSEKLYCFCCRLFAANVTETTSKFITGFDKWWKLSPKLHNHETSEEHLGCLEKWKTLAAGLRRHKTIDAESIAIMDREKKKWRDILHRLLDITLFLAKQNLAFRGHNEDEASLNRGNFLEMVEMLSKYDPVLKEHLMRLTRSTCTVKASVSYLSPETQNQFINVLANQVKEILVKDIKTARYFGIMFDSTPDISHTDQMSEVIRYVKIHNGKVEVKEVFLGFFPLSGKKADDLSSDILTNLKRDGLDIMMCRAQGYDNAATMSGIHGGVQAILKRKNKKAIFNGCVDHSLNLCGQHSFAENASCVTFFGTLEGIFSFFAASTHRWDVLIEHTGMSVKRLSTTRWSAHYAAVKPVKDKFDECMAAIEALCDPSENLDTRGTAQGLLHAVGDFTFICYLYLWADLLEEVNLTQQYLQTKGLTLDKVVTKLEALRLFLYEKRSHLVEHAIEQAFSKSDQYGISVERRLRFKKRMAGEQLRDAGLSLREENSREMLECIDRFHSELQMRSKAIKEVADMFAAVQPKSLLSASQEELLVSVPKLTSFYDELSEDELLKEIPRFRRHLKAADIDLHKAMDWSLFDVLQFIAEWDFLESLPILSLSLQLFLTICVSVASCERSFSKLKLIKNYLRSIMGQSRLSDLALLSIESETVKDIDFDEVIDRFAALKTRKGKL